MKKITNETLFRAIGELDEDLIAEAREEATEKREKEKMTHRFPLRRVLSAAACFVSVFAVSLALLSLPAAMQKSEAYGWNGEADGERSTTHEAEVSRPDPGTGKAEETQEEILPPELADVRDPDSEYCHGEKTGKDPETAGKNPETAGKDREDPEHAGTDDETAQDAPLPGPQKDDGRTLHYGDVFSRKEELIPIGVALGIAALVTVAVLLGTKKKNRKDR